MLNQNPEQIARNQINKLLSASGWYKFKLRVICYYILLFWENPYKLIPNKIHT